MLGLRKSSFHLYPEPLALPPRFQSRFRFLQVESRGAPGLASRETSKSRPLPRKNALPTATVTAAVTGTLNPTPGLSAVPLSLSPTRTCPQPASSPGPQVRTTAGFHAPQRPTSFGEEKGRHSPGPLPGRCPRCVRTLESHCLAGR